MTLVKRNDLRANHSGEHAQSMIVHFYGRLIILVRK